jgi:tripartite-type tricarboxylate transporter receptor subunit TctC
MEGCLMHWLRTLPAWGLAITSLLLSAPPTFAQSYPTRYVRIITAGVGTFHDIIARNLAHRLNERWGQPVVIDNQAAAGLTIGTAMAAKAAPDGYTLLLGDRSSLAAAPSLYKSLRYDPVKDLVPITMVARGPAMLVAHPSVPAGNLNEFIAYLRKQPDPVHFASSGAGTFTHLTGLQFEQLAGVKLLTVQYKGGGGAAVAVLGGEAKFSFFPIPVVLPQVSGHVEGLRTHQLAAIRWRARDSDRGRSRPPGSGSRTVDRHAGPRRDTGGDRQQAQS